MVLPKGLEWVRTYAHLLDHGLRGQLLDLHRPPHWLPCRFHGTRHRLVARFRRLPVLIGVEEECTHVRETLRQHGHEFEHLAALGMVCARVSPLALKDLVACKGVRRVWADAEVHALLDSAVPGADVRAVARRYTGQGVTIAIIDSGIYPHPDLSGRIAGFQDFVDRRTDPYDDNGHGTHVAGCAAGDGSQSGGQYKGPAPAARLVGVKVLNKRGVGSTSQIVAGLNWVISNKDRYGIRIASMSLGGSANRGCAGDPLCEAVGKVWDAGIAVVVAAGNDGPGSGTISTPGISPKVITVGAMDDHQTPDRADDAPADFSSRGPTPDGLVKPDLLSPGVGVTSLRSPNSYLDKAHPGARVGTWYLTLSGTSMATPIVSGICALLLEADPALTPDDVKARLQATAEDRGLAPGEQGAGYVDADRAVLS